MMDKQVKKPSLVVPVGLIGLVAPLGVMLEHWSWAQAAPDPLPTHWDFAGAVNGTSGAGPFFGWTLGISAMLAIVATLTLIRHRIHQTGRLLIAVLIGSSWSVAGIYLTSTLLARGHTSAEAVPLPWFAAPLMLLVPLAVGVLIWKILPAERMSTVQGPRTELGLHPKERVVWIAHAQSRGMRIAAVVLAVGAVVLMLLTSVVFAVLALVVALALAWVSELTVRVDQAGLRTLWGPFAWPRQLVRLPDIAAVHAQNIEPMQWGGWGLRVNGRGTAAIVRSGPGLVVQKSNGNTFVVTVDDAAQGADVLNALLVRGGTRD